jgi:cell division protein FtsN
MAMSKDYKRPEPKSRGGSGSLLVGILIGLVLGLGIALVVAWYINKMPSPFQGERKAAPSAKTDGAKSEKAAPPKGEDKVAKATEKPRFDFYKILPGAEEPATDQQMKDAQKKSVATASKEKFFLQAGAFQNAPDADNLKARLALIGVEAMIQSTAVPEKGTLHRVRVGPYTNVEELNRVRDTLKQNGIETALVKVRE